MSLRFRIPTFIILATLTSLSFNVYSQKRELTSLKGPYLGQNPPGKTPELFAPGIISTEMHEHSFPSFSPDGNQVFWYSQFLDNFGFPGKILESNNNNGSWTEPEFFAPIPFGNSSAPFFSPDGKRIYFTSTSEGLDKEKGYGKHDIWYIEKMGNTWLPPKNIGLPINSGEVETSATLTNDRTIYFTREIDTEKHLYGIHRSELIKGQYQTPELLPDNINTEYLQDWTPFIAPDESYLLFASGRPGGFGSDDIYISFRIDNTWTNPLNLGPTINTKSQERYPYVSPDGKYFFFATNNLDKDLEGEPKHNFNFYKEKMTKPGNSWNDTYWVDAGFIKDLQNKALTKNNEMFKPQNQTLGNTINQKIASPQSYPLGSFPVLKGPYLGQKPPGKIAKQFAPGIITTDLHDDASPGFSPDLEEIFMRIVYKSEGKYYSTIFFSKEEGNGWTIPQVAPFSGKTFNGGVHISKDGDRKYIRVNNAKNGVSNLDISVSIKTDGKWGPFRELSKLNSEFNEGSPFEAGTYLYWWTETKRNDPKPKFFRSKISDGEYSQKEQIFDFPDNALVDFINMEEGYALMTMRSKNTDYDIFISFRDKNGKWSSPINMGKAVNSESTEKAASISPDGKYIFFVSNRSENLNPKRIWNHPYFEGEEDIWKADVYWLDSSIIEDLRIREK